MNSEASVPRILLVDDDLATIELQKRRLHRAGFDAVPATDLEDALQQLQTGTIALMVVDYQLSAEFNGLEFYQQASERGVAPPTILVTGFSREDVVVDSLRAGIRDFVVKSTDYLDYLPHAVRQVLEKVGAERRLVESEARKSAMLLNALDAIVTIDEQGRIVEFNPAAVTMFGRGCDEVLGQRAGDLLVPLSKRAAFAEKLRKYLDDGAGNFLGHRWETSGLGADGVEFPIEISATVTGAAPQRLFTAFLTDVTERRRMETVLRLRQRVLDQISEGILFTDPNLPDNPIVYVNPAFTAITGYKAAEVLGRNCRFLQGAQTDAKAIDELRLAFENRRACSVEILNYRADGSPFWNAISISPLLDDNGRLTHFVGVQVDVTERRKLEEQIRHSQKMEAIGRLAGGIAHDFNNLLTVILGNAHTLSQRLTAESPESTELISETVEAAERGADLTRQLLAFGRKQILAPEPCDLNHRVLELESILRRLLGEHISLKTQLAPDLEFIQADAAQIDQVIMNLAVNARDAMRYGGSLVIETKHVNVAEEDLDAPHDIPAGRYVGMVVSDTGMGMNPETLAHIFEPFFTTKSDEGGTGLGLATVFGIVKQSAGSIFVSSEPGQGTKFELYFPRLSATDKTLATGESSINEAPSPARRSGERILLVEDEPRILRLASQFLQDANYDITEAAGSEAVSEWLSHSHAPLDLLITDVLMPGTNGRLVAEQVLGKYPGTPVLFMSGYPADIIPAGSFFLQKPFTRESLVREVREILGGDD